MKIKLSNEEMYYGAKYAVKYMRDAMEELDGIEEYEHISKELKELIEELSDDMKPYQGAYEEEQDEIARDIEEEQKEFYYSTRI